MQRLAFLLFELGRNRTKRVWGHPLRPSALSVCTIRSVVGDIPSTSLLVECLKKTLVPLASIVWYGPSLTYSNAVGTHSSIPKVLSASTPDETTAQALERVTACSPVSCASPDGPNSVGAL